MPEIFPKGNYHKSDLSLKRSCLRMNKLIRALWIAAAFIGGISVIGTIAAALKLTKKKYIEV